MSEDKQTTTAMERADERPANTEQEHRYSALLRGLQDPQRIEQLIAQICREPKIRACDRASVGAAIHTIVALGLDPTTALGQAYIVPYGRQAQPILGYRGLITLLARAGVEVTCGVVRAADRFSSTETTSGLHLIHEPGDPWDDSDETIMGAYAAFRIGGRLVHVERVPVHVGRELASKARGGSPWRDHFAAMLRKTPIRRGAKYLPLETDALRDVIVAIREDAEREGMLEQAPSPAIRVVQTQREALDALAESPAPAPAREPGDDDDWIDGGEG